MSRRKNSISFHGTGARSLAAAILIDSYGESAVEHTTGPMKEEVERQLATRKKTLAEPRIHESIQATPGIEPKATT
ncbi:MAG: hypothetical protein WC869_01220 [Phycisphaerae bacterium]|jgi:hypothetical protein